MLLNTRVLALSIGLLLTMIASTQVSAISASTTLRDAAVVREMVASGRLDEPATQVAVVPIIVNAGTALLPTIMGALANLLSILFSPRALGQVLRRRWKVAVIAAASLVLVGALGIPLLRAASSSRAAARAGGPPATEIDWAKVAENLIPQEGLHAGGDAPAREPTAPAEPVPGGVPADSPESVRLEAANAASGEGTASPAGLRPLWSFQPEDGMFLGTAAIVGTRVHVAANQTDLGGYTGLLASLDLETGKPIWQVTDAGKDTLLPFFSSPAVTADGKYVVIGQGLDQDRKRLFITTRERKFDKSGKFVKSWGSRGSDPGQLNIPHSIAIDAGGNVYVAEVGNKRIQGFTNDGEFKTQITGIGTPTAICISPGPNQYLFSSNSNDVRNLDNGEIYKLDLNGRVLVKFDGAGKLEKEFSLLNEIDCRNPNELLVAEIGTGEFKKFG